jgi:hypothetical protein
MTDREIFRVRIRRADYEVEVESSDKRYVDEKLREHLGSATPTVLATNAPPVNEGPRPTSLKEFAARVRPDKKVEIAASVAYYLEHLIEVPVTHWKPEDVASRFTEIRKERPKNMPNLLKSSLYFMQADEKGCYKLTDTGILWVRGRLETSEGQG